MDSEIEIQFCECDFVTLDIYNHCTNCGLPVDFIDYDDSPENYTIIEEE